jgi:hypothetical protein
MVVDASQIKDCGLADKLSSLLDLGHCPENQHQKFGAAHAPNTSFGF